MSAVLINKREIISAPFASQLDHIDKALFEFSYRKQTQQYSNNNSNSNNQAHQHNHQNQNQNHNNKFGNMNSKNNSRNNNNSYHHHQHGNNSHSFTRNATPASNNNLNNLKAHHGHHQQQSQVVMPPHRGVSPQQQMGYQNVIKGSKQNMMIQHPQPMNFNGLNDRSNSRISNGSAAIGSTEFNQYNNVIASSPDSFVEELLSPVSRLSTSVTSSGTNGSSNYELGSNQFHVNTSTLLINGFEKANIQTNGTGFGLSSSSTAAGSNNNNNNNYNVGFNGNEFNNGGANNRAGWLNLWGNDMSVWG